MSGRLRALRVLIGLFLVIGLLGWAPEGPIQSPPVAAAAAPSAKLTVAPAKPMRGEAFLVTGSIGGSVTRPVILQRKSGRSWKTIITGATDSTGAFELPGSTISSSLTVRVFAPAEVSGQATLSAIKTAEKKISIAKQKAKLSIKSTAYVNQALVANITLTPARNQRPVVLQVRQAGKWVDLASGVTDAKGKAVLHLNAAAKGKFSYRAKGLDWNGASAVGSSTKKLTIKADKAVVSPDARPLSKSEVASISSYSADTGVLVLASAPNSAKKIVVDDIIPIPPRDGIPSGALRRVTAVSRQGSTTTIQTTTANLVEAVTNVPDDASQIAMSPIDAGTFEPAEGVTVTKQAKLASTADELSPARTGVTTASSDLDIYVNLKLTTASGFSVSTEGNIAWTSTPFWSSTLTGEG